MAWGGSSVVLLLVSAVLLIAAGLGVFLLGLRHNPRGYELATAYVMSVSAPPAGAIVAKCDMKVRLNLTGRAPIEVKIKDSAVHLVRWPQAGQTLPVEVEQGNSRQARVRWDLIELGYVRAPDPTPARSYPSARTSSPTPQRDPTRQQDTAPTVRLHERYADPSLNDDYSADPVVGDVEATVRTPTPAVDPYAVAEPDDFERVLILPDPLDYPDFDPADVDRTDFAPDIPPRTIPSPRPAEEPTLRVTGDGTEVPADAAGPAVRDGAAIGGMLIVSDLDRSLRFYSEKLGFTIVYSASGNAVVEYGGARILLQHMADFSGIDRRVGHLHIQVPDVEAAFADLVSKGVDFSHRPKMVSRSDDLELWKATFRDPDGHGVALTEWRQRR
jgi:catechol 2,3-dioxygenase-like lactoylglutathione lyase family enzyme